LATRDDFGQAKAAFGEVSPTLVRVSATADTRGLERRPQGNGLAQGSLVCSRHRPRILGQDMGVPRTNNQVKEQEPEAWTPPDGSWASSAANRKSMQGNRSRDTTPELAIRRLLHAEGLRYRVNRSPLKGLRRRADVIFGPSKVAVFIDGCYWHGCPDHYVPPKTNPGYWSPKISGNIARDRDTDARLTEAGWLVLRFWEHENAAECSSQIAAAVRERRAAGRRAPLPRSPRGSE